MKEYKNKNMISKTLFRNALVLFIFAQLLFFFSACGNLINKNETGPSYLSIQVSSASRGRTALPSFSITSISSYQFIIEGKKAGADYEEEDADNTDGRNDVVTGRLRPEGTGDPFGSGRWRAGSRAVGYRGPELFPHAG